MDKEKKIKKTKKQHKNSYYLGKDFFFLYKYIFLIDFNFRRENLCETQQNEKETFIKKYNKQQTNKQKICNKKKKK